MKRQHSVACQREDKNSTTRRSAHNRKTTPSSKAFYFFPRGHSNQSGNLIGSYRGPDFPISDHGHGNGGKQRR